MGHPSYIGLRKFYELKVAVCINSTMSNGTDMAKNIIVGLTRQNYRKDSNNSSYSSTRGHANFGKVRNITTKNPMYIPISASSNSIEIYIRSDSGRLFPFSDGTVTSLTLHFKKVRIKLLQVHIVEFKVVVIYLI